jgi:DNA mismatch repair protein MutS2
MLYPKNIENKLGFDKVREMVKAQCLSTLGKSLVDEMTFTDDAEQINQWMAQIREMRAIADGNVDFPLTNCFDMREALKRVRIQNTWLEESELFDIKRSLETINALVDFLYQGEAIETPDDGAEAEGNAEDTAGDLPVLKKWLYPALHDLADGVATFPILVQQINQIIDKFGHLRDNASPELFRIRKELAAAESSISGILNRILRSAQSDGVVDKDVTPTLRDGRLVIPVMPSMKRKIQGIVHDESATGRTVYIEPTEVVEANNHVRELEAEERQEVIRILTVMSARIRPHVREILDSFAFLAQIDFIQAKARLAKTIDAFEPQVQATPLIDWIRARHPLLELHLKDRIVPLDIMLKPEERMLIISGPNAGGKSVCLKTVGLLQYMLQTGLSIPVWSRSRCGVFKDVMIDIGDEQSLENDLSTYSSHLMNMKVMMRQASDRSLILIDEMGTGTEPQIGGAIAESVLEEFCQEKAWAVITTHYQNLKHFAKSHDGVVNGAMLYDRHEMRPLFQLAIGRPGSSFAIEIARKIGLPEKVIKHASDIVGSDYIQSDNYLQDIVRDKRYWEQKRATIHEKEKELQRRIDQYESGVNDVARDRKAILDKARQQAEDLLRESNKRIENAIRTIKEEQAEKEATRQIRAELDTFKQSVSDDSWQDQTKRKGAGLLTDEDFQKKVEQIEARKRRKAERKAKRAKEAAEGGKAPVQKPSVDRPLAVGDAVQLKGLQSKGILERINGKNGVVAIGDMHTNVPLNRLQLVVQTSGGASGSGAADGASGDGAGVGASGIGKKTKMDELTDKLQSFRVSHVTQDTIDDHRKNFRQDLDVRGMRGDEALTAVRYFIDDAILMGVPRVRILHGKGNGILQQLIRQYLSAEPSVSSFRDEDVRFGGAGITVVDL